jgi:hypothetical protein
MIASVKYGDYEGTTAADISDFETLSSFLKDHNVDTDKYEPIGIKYQSYYDINYSVIALLKDRIRTNHGDDDIIISKAITVTTEEFFCLFKRLEFILLAKGY